MTYQLSVPSCFLPELSVQKWACLQHSGWVKTLEIVAFVVCQENTSHTVASSVTSVSDDHPKLGTPLAIAVAACSLEH